MSTIMLLSKKPLLFALLMMGSWAVLGQASKRLLPHNINLSGYNNFSPAISGDGNVLVYLSDYSNDGEMIMLYSTRLTMRSWKDSKEVDRPANIPSITFRGGYALNFDGSVLYITNKKTGGLGGYDIWYSEWNGSSWGSPKNFGKPINSSVNDGSPSLSTDGLVMYFMRCEKMTNGSAENCRIMMSEKIKGRWQEATELPSPINNGNEMAPKILSDNQTLIFASDRIGGKGGFDLYLSRRTETGWSEPINLDFVNTPEDDIFSSVAAKGRYIMIDRNGGRGRVIEEVLIPSELQPKKVLQVVGHAVDGNTSLPLSATAKVYIPDTRKRIIFKKTDTKGDYNFGLIEGEVYDFSLEPEDASFYTFSKLYDLSTMKNSTRDELKVKFNKKEPGIKNELGAIAYQPETSELSDASVYELRRLTRLIKANPAEQFVFSVELYDFRSDSIAANELTEVRRDTLQWEEETAVLDSLTNEPTDSVQIQHFTKVTTTYDNNKTEKQAQALLDYLVSKGIPEEQLSYETATSIKPEGVDGPRSKWKPLRIFIRIKEE